MFRQNKIWLDNYEYPFLSHYHFTDVGKMHYIDEGTGEILVFLHGNPTWSFTWRKLIKGLSRKYRCIAPDYIGFGFSDKPDTWSYLPYAHAANFENFVQRLGLQNITLVVNDWGGPIGLSYAVKYPQNVKRIILFNTWMWSVKGNKYYERFSSFMGGALGRFLIRNFNFFGRSVVSMATGEKQNFPKHIRQVYYKHLENKKDRKGCWVFPKEIINSSEWLDSLWQQKEKIKNIPALIIWGMKDIAFRKDVLAIWEKLFTNKKVIVLYKTGHYPQEEKGDDLIEPIQSFCSKNFETIINDFSSNIHIPTSNANLNRYEN